MTCGECKFFQKNSDENGECRYSTPIRLPDIIRAIRENQIAWGWPPVSIDQWCGKFESKTS